jgi:hypothetical protein
VGERARTCCALCAPRFRSKERWFKELQSSSQASNRKLGARYMSRFSLTHLSKRPHLTYMQPCALRVAFKTHLAGRDGAVSAREAEFME